MSLNAYLIKNMFACAPACSYIHAGARPPCEVNLRSGPIGIGGARGGSGAPPSPQQALGSATLASSTERLLLRQREPEGF